MKSGVDGGKRLRSDVRVRFIDETARLMRENGSDRVSTRLICDAVGVTAPSLYHHFGDLQGLQHAAFENAYDRFMESWEARSATRAC
ncbi:MAG: TetR/AcrR family transcriptional regulator [Sphingomonadaceae bacterium]